MLKYALQIVMYDQYFCVYVNILYVQLYMFEYILRQYSTF